MDQGSAASGTRLRQVGWSGIHPPEPLGGYGSYDQQHLKYVKTCKPLGLTWNPWNWQPLGEGDPWFERLQCIDVLEMGGVVSPTHIGNPIDSAATGLQASSQGLICNMGKREMAASSPRMAPCEHLKDPGSTCCHPSVYSSLDLRGRVNQLDFHRAVRKNRVAAR